MAGMFASTSSHTELLLRANDFGSLMGRRRSPKTPLIVGSAIAVILVLSVSIGLASKHRSRTQNGTEEDHPVMARLASAKLEFAGVNVSAPARNSSGQAFVDFHGRGGKGDDYGELDKI